MFIYEKGNSINIAFSAAKPVETPDVIVKGYQNGAALIIGDKTFGVKDGVEYEGKAKTLVCQKDAKLIVTFRGIEGMNEPEVTIDEISDGVFDVVVSGESVKLSIVDGEVVIGESTKVEEEVTPVKEEEPEVQDEVIEEVEEEQPEEEVVEE